MQLVSKILLSATLVAAVRAAPGTARNGSDAPVVDLGYVLQQGIYNDTGSYYNFTNVRYAAAPVGNLRWRAPQQPPRNRDNTQAGGSYPIICPQATTGWGLGLDPTTIDPLNVSLPAQKLGSQEDCLFLDVFAPKSVFESKEPNAAVMVWIHGGSFIGGSKAVRSPWGLLKRSLEEPTTGGVVYVAINYRLGALGFLSPDATGDGIANAGLLDQRLALEWVRQHIHLFGGDKDKVMVFGESAGGGSIIHQITAYGGNDTSVAPFNKAIIQSPGWNPTGSSAALEKAVYQSFLSLLNVTSLQAARQVTSAEVILANYRQVFISPSTSSTFGPIVDGTFVPDHPARLLATGRFNKQVEVMVGYNANEGLYFIPEIASEEALFIPLVASAMPTASNETLAYIANVLYPPIYDGSKGYTDPYNRTLKAFNEFAFTCSTFFVSLAYGNNTYAYQFAVPPAVHGQDVDWTYFTGDVDTPDQPIDPSQPIGEDSPGAVSNVTVAMALQEFETSFAQTGIPVAAKGIPSFERYGKEARLLVFGQEGVSVVKDDEVTNERCRWWQKLEYL